MLIISVKDNKNNRQKRNAKTKTKQQQQKKTEQGGWKLQGKGER